MSIMGAGSRSLSIPYGSQLHDRIKQKVRSRIELSMRGGIRDRYEKWQKAEEVTVAWMPESEADAKRRTDRETLGTPKYTTIVVPYTYGVMMAAHTYWTSVFFARTPIHQFSGRHGEGEMQVQAMEALIGYQVEVGNMMGPYYIWLYDAGKYGLGVLGTYWEVEKIHYGQIVEIIDPTTGVPAIYQATQEVERYRGKRTYTISPYDFFPDPRVPVGRFQDGEFCNVRKRLGWHQVLRRKDAGYFINTDQLKEHAGTDRGWTEGSAQLPRPQFTLQLDDVDEKGGKSKHPAGIVFFEQYVEIIPKEWGLGSSEFPEKWCFSIIEDYDVINGASPLGYVHGKFPVDVLEMEVEGYGNFNRGVPEIVQGIQQTMDWLLNTHFYNVRAVLNNQFIIDPSKIVIKDAAKAGPGFTWRLRPEAYGSDISKIFMQVPMQDVTRTHVADMQIMLGIGERALGVNDQIMGVLNSGGRKTATEVRTTTGFGVNRMKTVTEYMSATSFAPHAQKLVQTSQQMYDSSAKLRIAGGFALDAGMDFVNVTPEKIAGFYDLVPVDGTLPIDRMAQANLWKEIMASATRMPPQIVMEYDWSRIFAWASQIAGLKNIRQFRVQVAPPGVMPGAGMPGGNVIPMPGRRAPAAPVTPGNSASTAAGLNSLGGEGGAGSEGY